MRKRSNRKPDLNQETAGLVQEARQLREQISVKLEELRAELERRRLNVKEGRRLDVHIGNTGVAPFEKGRCPKGLTDEQVGVSNPDCVPVVPNKFCRE